MKSPQNEEQQKFWEAFRTCVEENRVGPDRSSFLREMGAGICWFFAGKAFAVPVGKRYSGLSGRFGATYQ